MSANNTNASQLKQLAAGKNVAFTAATPSWSRRLRPGERVRTVANLRDLGISLVTKLGQWEKCGAIRGLTATHGALHVSYRTPFQKLPQPSEFDKYQDALLGGKPNLPYGLDIWWEGKKVMNVEWSDRGEFDVVSYRKGRWEDSLRAAAASLHAPVGWWLV